MLSNYDLKKKLVSRFFSFNVPTNFWIFILYIILFKPKIRTKLNFLKNNVQNIDYPWFIDSPCIYTYIRLSGGVYILYTIGERDSVGVHFNGTGRSIFFRKMIFGDLGRKKIKNLKSKSKLFILFDTFYPTIYLFSPKNYLFFPIQRKISQICILYNLWWNKLFSKGGGG